MAVSLDELARTVVEDGVASACAVGWAARTRGGDWVQEVGASGADVALFDLASVTKPLTALAVARAGLRRARLGELVAEARGRAAGDAPLELLLAHRAGLADHLPLFWPLLDRGEPVERGPALARTADAVRDDARGPGPHAPVYSDLGYILVGEALARHLGVEDAGLAIDALVVRPLGLERDLGTARELAGRGIDVGAAAPTEHAPWRGGVVQGAVHDENAWALTGLGGSGHAGAFGTARAVLTFAAAALDAIELGRGPLAVGDDLGWLIEERPGGTLRAGFDGKSPAGSSAGARAGARTFGHLGFTGTSVWIDPDAGIAVTMLSNRVHPTRDNVRIREARPRVHDALFERARARIVGTKSGMP